MHPAALADEACSVADLGTLIGKDDRGGVRVFKAQFPAQHGIATATLRVVAAAFDTHRSGGVGAIAPLGDVEMMNAPAGNHAEGEVRDVLVIVALQLVSMKGRHRCGADPALPIDKVRHRLLLPSRCGLTARDTDLNFLQLSEPAILRQFSRPAEF